VYLFFVYLLARFYSTQISLKPLSLFEISRRVDKEKRTKPSWEEFESFCNLKASENFPKIRMFELKPSKLPISPKLFSLPDSITNPSQSLVYSQLGSC
jgi:hypothetical protein